jgi:hypothetical protein
MLNVLGILGFDHDSSLRLCARITKDHAARITQCPLGIMQGSRYLRERFERRFRPNLHVQNGLRIRLEIVN